MVALSRVDLCPTVGVIPAAASKGFEERDAIRVRIKQRSDTGTERHPRSCGYFGDGDGLRRPWFTATIASLRCGVTPAILAQASRVALEFRAILGQD